VGERAEEGQLTLLEGLLLGILQGLGEFLPISSSAHLIVVPWALGWEEHSLAFDVALHVGTLAAVFYAFAADWKRLVLAGLKRPDWSDPDNKLIWLLALATLPGGVAGLLLDDWAETTFRSPALVAASMATLGLILLAADRIGARRTGIMDVGLQAALLIGLAQGLALVPGVSRSGATISMALFLGLRREDAARFSFLLATPITLGAALVKLPDLAGGTELLPAVVGMVAAGLVGLASIRVLLAYVRTRSYLPFVAYRLVFAAAVAALLLVR